MAADIEFFFDPLCPFAWITSRWVCEVQDQRDLDVEWRFISLWMLNEANTAEWYTPEYRAGHYIGQQGLRIADAIRLEESDPAAVGRWYTGLGTALHVHGRRGTAGDDIGGFLADVLAGAGFAAGYVDAADDESHDAYIRAETELALSRTGRDVGTPIITYGPGTEAEASLFGPVISKAPRGVKAVELWDAVETIARSGVAEIKRSNRAPLDFT